MGLQFSFPEQTGPVAINTVGTLTINDGVVTGFNATSNYLQCSQKIDFTQSDYEIAVRVKPTSFSATTFLFSQGGLTLALGSGSDAGKVELYITLETSGYTAYKQLYTTTLNAIWSLIFKRTGGTKYEVFVANDSGIRTLIKTLNTSENITSGNESNILRWGGGNTFSQYLQGSLYLQGTYATANNQLWAGKYYQTPEPLGVVIDEGTEINSTDYKIVGNELLEANSSIYLQSSGTQRIDTGVIRSNLTDTYTYKGSISFADVTTRQCVGAQGYFYFGVVNGHYQIAQGGTDYVSGTTAVANKFVDFDIKFQPVASRADYKIDTYSGAVTNTIFQNTPENAHINLFSLNDLVLPSSCKISRFKIYRNEVLLRDFVPVPQGLVIGSYTVPSNGMWDIVNQQFYANAGTGTFEIGKGPRQATYVILNDKLVWANKKTYAKGTATYSFVGSPTVIDGVMSNFTVSNYAQIPMPNFATANSWEIVCKAKVNALTDNYQIFYTSSMNNQAIGLDIDSSGKLAAAIGKSSGNGWLIIETGSWSGTKKTVPLNTFFWTKLLFTGSQYKIQYSADGSTWEDTIYYNTTSKISYGSSYTFNFGINRFGDSLTLNGSIDFKETYIIIDGALFFYGKNYSSSNISFVPSGLTYGNTTTPSVGYVDIETQQFTSAPTGATWGKDN